MNRPRPPSPVVDLLLLLAGSLLIKGLGIYLQPVVNPDGIRYINAARELLEGDIGLGLSYVGHLPAYPLLLAGARLIVPDWVLAGQLLSIAGFTLAVVPLYFLTREMFGRPAALWSGIAFVLSPVINGYAVEILREPVAVCLLLWAAWMGVRAWRACRPADIFLASLLALLATLFRVEGVLFLAVLLGVLLLGGESGTLRKGKAAAIALAPWILLLVPLALGGVLAAPFTGSHGIGLLAADLRSFNLLGTYPEVYAAFKEFEGNLPNANWSNDAAEIARHYLPLIYLVGAAEAVVSCLYLPFFLLAVVGWLRPPVRISDGRFLLLLAASFFLGAYFTLLHRNFVSDRYLLAPAVFLFPWVGAGLETLRANLSASRRRIWATLLLALIFSLPLAQSAENWSSQGGVLRDAGSWLGNIKGLENLRLICNDERIPFYAGLWRDAYIVASAGESGNIAAAVSTQPPDLLVLEVSARSRLPEPPAGFVLLQDFADGKNQVAIFRRQP